LVSIVCRFLECVLVDFSVLFFLIIVVNLFLPKVLDAYESIVFAVFVLVLGSELVCAKKLFEGIRD
jgi:hypothetical protein